MDKASYNVGELEECMGCLYNRGACNFKAMNAIDKCPCTECLVKVTCNSPNKRECELREPLAIKFQQMLLISTSPYYRKKWKPKK